MGGVIGQLFRKRGSAKWGALSAGVVCAIAAAIVERKRRRVVKEERRLLRDIERQRITNDDLRAENEELLNRAERMERQAEQLLEMADRDGRRAAEIAAEIEAAQQAAPSAIELTQEQINVAQDALDSGNLSEDDEQYRRREIENLRQRILLWERIQAIQIPDNE